MKKVKRALVWVFSGVLVLGVAAFADVWSVPNAPGKLIEIDGRMIHVNCTGPADATQSVWFEAAGPEFSTAWGETQRRLADRSLHSCSYDRSGFGWSEPYTGPYDVEREIRDGYSALSRLDPDRPLILVGHSSGGLLIRAMAARVADRLVGMVYVDPATIALWQSGLESGELGNWQAPGPTPWPAVRFFTRLVDSKPENVSELRWKDRQLTQRMQITRAFATAFAKAQERLADQLRILEQFPPPRDVPSVVIRRSGNASFFSEELNQIWNESFRTELIESIDEARLLIAEGSDHWIPRNSPQSVVEAVLSLSDAGHAE